MSEKRKYDSTVARIAGNLLSGHPKLFIDNDGLPIFDGALIGEAVLAARAIVAEVERTEPGVTR